MDGLEEYERIGDMANGSIGKEKVANESNGRYLCDMVSYWV